MFHSIFPYKGLIRSFPASINLYTTSIFPYKGLIHVIVIYMDYYANIKIIWYLWMNHSVGFAWRKRRRGPSFFCHFANTFVYKGLNRV